MKLLWCNNFPIQITQYFNTFHLLKNNQHYLSQCPLTIQMLTVTMTRQNYLMITFSQCLQLIPALTPTQFSNTDTDDLHIIHDIVINDHLVYNGLCALDTSKAAGTDDLNPKIFKNCASSLLLPICHLFTICIRSAKIPAH